MLSSMPTPYRLPVCQLPGSVLESQKKEQGLGWDRAEAVHNTKDARGGCCWFPGVAAAERHRLGGFTNRRVFSHSPGGWKSELKVLAG